MVYEDEATLAFMDLHPAARGHTLVIPREHYADLFELSDGAGAALLRTARNVARALREAFVADGLSVTQANGLAAGQSVFHFHFHLIPRHFGDHLPVPKHSGRPADRVELAELAAVIREHL